MKKMILMAVVLISIAAMAQGPAVITFNKTTHDFGQINEADGNVTTVFEFKNDGGSPLVLQNVKASCGCTTPKYTREPIEPGKTGQITVTYRASGRPGTFNKTVTVTSNATTPTIRLYIKGNVIPKPVNPAEQFTMKVGQLNFKKKTMNFGAIFYGDKPRTLEIPYANLTSEVVTLDVALSPNSEFIKPLVTLKEIQPNQQGKIQVTLVSGESPIYGPVNVKLYLLYNGKREQIEEQAITLMADIKEDFRKLSEEEKQLAPIAEIQQTLNLGTVKIGKKLATKLEVHNAGINPLIIRRVIANDEHMTATTPKAAIKNGRTAAIAVEINTSKLQPTQYTRVVKLITNDPNKSVIDVRLTWTVE